MDWNGILSKTVFKAAFEGQEVAVSSRVGLAHCRRSRVLEPSGWSMRDHAIKLSGASRKGDTLNSVQSCALNNTEKCTKGKEKLSFDLHDEIVILDSLKAVESMLFDASRVEKEMASRYCKVIYAMQIFSTLGIEGKQPWLIYD